MIGAIAGKKQLSGGVVKLVHMVLVPNYNDFPIGFSFKHKRAPIKSNFGALRCKVMADVPEADLDPYDSQKNIFPGNRVNIAECLLFKC